MLFFGVIVIAGIFDQRKGDEAVAVVGESSWKWEEDHGVFAVRGRASDLRLLCSDAERGGFKGE